MRASSFKTHYIAPFVVAICVACSLQAPIEDRRKAVTKLRDAIKDLVDGTGSEISWYASPGESYVLFAGYMTEEDLIDPGIPSDLRKNLAAIAPQDERYVVALVDRVHVEDFALFEHGWPRSQQNISSPVLLEPCPLVMPGRPFKLKKHVTANGNIMLSIE